MKKLNLFEEIKLNAGVLAEENMTLGMDAQGKRMLENQDNATDVIERAFAQYVKNKKVIEGEGYPVGPVRVAQRIIRDLKNPQLARLQKKADSLVAAYDAFRKTKISDAQIK